MKVTIERAALLRALAHVQSVVERRNTIPILSNVLIEAKDGKLALSATDMDLAIREEVPAEVGKAASTTAAAHTLYDIVRKLPEGSQVALELASGGGQLTLRAGRARFSLSCLPVDEFPVMSAGELPHNFTLEAASLRSLIDRTRFAISTEETRYYLNGIYLHAAKADRTEFLRAVATDGHRLARFQMPLPDGAKGVPGVIVPRKAVNEVRKLIEETTEAVEVSLSETRVRFAFDSVVLTSKLIDGTFPDYERVIPADNDKVMEVNPREFAQAVDRVSTISKDQSRAVKLALARGTLTLSASGQDTGSATEEIEVGYAGDGLEIGFNARYLLDIAQQIEGDGCQFVMADAASPTIVRDGADASALYVLMPMRV
jgi:DNA polymerase-3 subunit beta